MGLVVGCWKRYFFGFSWRLRIVEVGSFVWGRLFVCERVFRRRGDLGKY